MWSSEAVLVLYFPTAVWLDFQNTVPHKLKGALKKKKKGFKFMLFCRE